MAPRPWPETLGTSTPQQANMGVNASEVLSPIPPVECLSTFGLPERQRMTWPEFDKTAGQGYRLVEGHALEVNGHGKCRQLIVGDRSVGVAVYQRFDFTVFQLMTVPFLANNLRYVHARFMPTAGILENESS